MAKKKTKAKPKVKAKSKSKSSARKPSKSIARMAKRSGSKKSVRKAAPRSKGPAKKSMKSASPGGLPKWVAQGANYVSPYLIVRDVKAAINFYQNAFGFKLRNAMPGPDNTIVHAEMTHFDALVMMGAENPERGAVAPQGPSPVTMYVYVDDVDEVTSRANLQGGNVVSQPEDLFWGDRCSVITDPDGHSWMLATHVKDVPFDEMVPPPK